MRFWVKDVAEVQKQFVISDSVIALHCIALIESKLGDKSAGLAIIIKRKGSRCCCQQIKVYILERQKKGRAWRLTADIAWVQVQIVIAYAWNIWKFIYELFLQFFLHNSSRARSLFHTYYLHNNLGGRLDWEIVTKPRYGIQSFLTKDQVHMWHLEHYISICMCEQLRIVHNLHVWTIENVEVVI